MHDISTTLLGVTGLLALVTLLVPVAARANVAFSLVLAVAGIALGLAVEAAVPLGLSGPLGDFVTALSQFDLSSEAFILLFLPVLLFETAVAVDVRGLKDDIIPILLLAVIAVLVSTFAVGVSLAAVSEVGLVACLLLAAIVSTTDPIAVVAIFRDLGVPHRLNLLVEGESLFNDAAAITLFTLFLGMVTAEREPDVLAGIWIFVRGFAGGLAFGGLCGALVCWGFTLLRGQRAAEITTTVAAAYLVFLLGEHTLHVSGVVAVVTAGLVVGYEGRTRVSATTWTSLVDVWSQVGYWASTLIFLLATMRVPGLLAGMNARDLVLLAMLAGSAMAARGLVLFGLFPAMARLGWAQPMSRPIRLVVMWGGLRGAISLALALAVVENPKVPPEIKSFVAVLTTAFVLSTLFVNAPLLRPLIRLFHLDRLSPGDLAVRDRALATTLAEVRHKVADAAEGLGIDARAAGQLALAYTERLRRAEEQAAALAERGLPEDIRAGLAMLAEREQAIYLRQYQEGFSSGAVARSLLALTARLQDGIKTDGIGGYRAAMAAFIGFPRPFRLALAWQRRTGSEAPLAHLLADRFERLLMVQAAMREMLAFAWEKLPLLLSAEAAQTVTATIAERLAQVDTAIAALRLQYADFSHALQLHTLERATVRIERAEFRRLRQEGMIGHEVYADLMADLATRERKLAERPPLDLQLDPTRLLAAIAPFAALSADELTHVVRRLRPLLAVPGETILRRGETGRAMYFIASGAVEVRVEPNPIRLGNGDFFGELALLNRSSRTADVVALGFCSLLELSDRDFQAMLSNNPALRDHILTTAGQRMAAAPSS